MPAGLECKHRPNGEIGALRKVKSQGFGEGSHSALRGSRAGLDLFLGVESQLRVASCHRTVCPLGCDFAARCVIVSVIKVPRSQNAPFPCLCGGHYTLTEAGQEEDSGAFWEFCVRCGLRQFHVISESNKE